jgi:hypothetical protein
MPIKRIARIVGVNRNTARKYVRLERRRMGLQL